MKWLNIVTLLLLIVGGVNWGLVALGGHEMDLVANIFGGDESGAARVVYALVGLSALWQILPWAKSLRTGEVHARPVTAPCTPRVSRGAGRVRSGAAGSP